MIRTSNTLSLALAMLLLLLAYAVDRSEEVPVAGPEPQQGAGDSAAKTKMCGGSFDTWMNKMCTFFGESNSCLKNEVRVGE